MSKETITTHGPDQGKTVYSANRKHGSGNGMHCHRDDHDLWREILASRDKAAEKHRENSIEEIEYDNPKWFTILMEEIGELAHEFTYDSSGTNISKRAELMDIAAVVTAWITRIDIDS